MTKKVWRCGIASLLLFLYPGSGKGDAFSGSESSSDTQTGSGGQQIGWDENYSEGSGQTRIQSGHETNAATGEVTETQTITHTNPDGSTYTETTTTHYDDFTGEITTTHTESGTPAPEAANPPSVENGGVETGGKANGEGITSRYGDGGGEDIWNDSSGNAGRQNWFDMENGSSGSVNHGNKSGSQIPSLPARSVPLICQASTLGFKDYNKFKSKPLFFPKPQPGKLPDMKKLQKDIEKLQREAAKLMAQAKADMQNKKKPEFSKMVLKKISWKHPLRINGYKTEHYQIWGDNKKRGDIWIVPDIDVGKIMRGGKAARDKHIQSLLVPIWAKGDQATIFKKLVVLFKEPGRHNSLRVNTIRKTDYRFAKPRFGADYKIHTYTTEEIKRSTDEALKLWLQ